MKSYIFNGIKFTPSIQRKNGILFFGTGAECEKYVEDNSLEDAVIYPLEDVRLGKKDRLIYGELWMREKQCDAYFVKAG